MITIVIVSVWFIYLMSEDFVVAALETSSPTPTPQQQQSPLQGVHTRFVLLQTHHPGNVGASARAMKTMGFEDLILVEPHDMKVLNRKRTHDGASGALDIIRSARIIPSLHEAIAECDIVCATGMARDMSHIRTPRQYVEPRPYFQQLIKQQQQEIEKNNKNEHQVEPSLLRIAFLFGNEKLGMKEDDIDQADIVLGIPANPKFGSINLASAVQLIAYDWRQAIGGF